VARTQAKILTSIWSDPDWLALTGSAQRLYLLLLSQPKLTIVGSLDVIVDRWARLGTDTTADAVRADLEALAQPQGQSGRPWIVVDDDELILRTFVTHDLGSGTVNRNLVKGMWSAWAALASPLLRKVVVDEMPDAVFNRDEVDRPSQASDLRKQPRSEPWFQPRSGPQTEPQSEPSVDLLSAVCSLPTATSPSLRTTHEVLAEAGPIAADDQSIRRTAVLVGKALAERSADTNPGGYAAEATKRILTGDDPTDRDRIVAALAAGDTPETIAAGWVPDPLATVVRIDGGSRERHPTARPLPAFDPAAHEAEAERQRKALDALEAQ
jgi:hypothetical protein